MKARFARFLVWAFCAAAVVLVRPTATKVVLCALAVTLLAPIAIRIAQGRFDIFEPTVLFAMSFGVMFVVRPIAMLGSGAIEYWRPTRTIDLAGTFRPMLVIALLGSLGFLAGYSSTLGRRLAVKLPAVPAKLNERAAMSGGVGLALLGSLAFLLLLRTIGGYTVILGGRTPRTDAMLGQADGYLVHASWVLVPAVILLLAVARARRDLLCAVVALGVLGIVLLRTVPLGSRMMLLPLVGGGVVYWYVSRHSRPRFASALLFVVLALCASSALLTARAKDAAPSLRDSGPLLSPRLLTAPLTQGADAEMAPALAAAMKIVRDDVGYLHGRATLGDFFIRPIPRGVWNGKPLSPREQVIQAGWPVEYRLAVANPEFSVLLYPYLDFGPPAVVLWMFGYGLLARVGYEYFQRHREKMAAQLIYAMLLPFLVIALRDSPVDTFQRMVFLVLPLVLVLFRAGRRAQAVDTGARVLEKTGTGSRASCVS